MIFKLSIFILLASFSYILSQENVDIENDDFIRIIPKHSYSLDLTLPVSHKNKAFKGVMQGLCRFSFMYNYHFKKPLSLGICYNYSFFQINKFKTPQKVQGGLSTHSYSCEIAYKDFYNERLGLEINFKSGYSNHIITSDSLKLNGIKNKKKDSYFFEPSFAIVVTTSKNSSFKWISGYNIQLCNFNLYDIGLKSTSNYPINDIKKIQYFFFGFSITHYFVNR